MDFSEALKELKNGKKIARKKWKDDDIYLCLEIDRFSELTIFMSGDGVFKRVYLPRAWELLAEDWFIFEEKAKS